MTRSITDSNNGPRIHLEFNRGFSLAPSKSKGKKKRELGQSVSKKAGLPSFVVEYEGALEVSASHLDLELCPSPDVST